MIRPTRVYCGVMGCPSWGNDIKVVPVNITQFELSLEHESRWLKHPFNGIVKLPLCSYHREEA